MRRAIDDLIDSERQSGIGIIGITIVRDDDRNCDKFIRVRVGID